LDYGIPLWPQLTRSGTVQLGDENVLLTVSSEQATPDEL
jgi:hypothetical protein